MLQRWLVALGGQQLGPQVISVLLSAVIACSPESAFSAELQRDSVTRVVDGDTVVLNSLGKARLIGVNTPETVSPAQRKGAPPECYGPEASAKLKAMLPPGTAVDFETDVEPTDRFGRSLIYLYLEDGTFVNADLVKNGFAVAKAYKPNVAYRSTFESLQGKAKAEGIGLWTACAPESKKGSDERGSSGSGFGPEARVVTRPSPVVVKTRAQREAASKAASSMALTNPGDVKNCADFASYGEAKAWYDRYFDAFGDVAKLDGDGDGIPCESLYRRAIAKTQ
jgi:micrococcal nuclease